MQTGHRGRKNGKITIRAIQFLQPLEESQVRHEVEGLSGQIQLLDIQNIRIVHLSNVPIQSLMNQMPTHDELPEGRGEQVRHLPIQFSMLADRNCVIEILFQHKHHRSLPVIPLRLIDNDRQLHRTTLPFRPVKMNPPVPCTNPIVCNHFPRGIAVDLNGENTSRIVRLDTVDICPHGRVLLAGQDNQDDKQTTQHPSECVSRGTNDERMPAHR